MKRANTTLNNLSRKFSLSPLQHNNFSINQSKWNCTVVDGDGKVFNCFSDYICCEARGFSLLCIPNRINDFNFPSFISSSHLRCLQKCVDGENSKRACRGMILQNEQSQVNIKRFILPTVRGEANADAFLPCHKTSRKKKIIEFN